MARLQVGGGHNQACIDGYRIESQTRPLLSYVGLNSCVKQANSPGKRHSAPLGGRQAAAAAAVVGLAQPSAPDSDSPWARTATPSGLRAATGRLWRGTAARHCCRAPRRRAAAVDIVGAAQCRGSHRLWCRRGEVRVWPVVAQPLALSPARGRRSPDQCSIALGAGRLGTGPAQHATRSS